MRRSLRRAAAERAHPRRASADAVALASRRVDARVAAEVGRRAGGSRAAWQARAAVEAGRRGLVPRRTAPAGCGRLPLMRPWRRQRLLCARSAELCRDFKDSNDGLPRVSRATGLFCARGPLYACRSPFLSFGMGMRGLVLLAGRVRKGSESLLFGILAMIWAGNAPNLAKVACSRAWGGV